MTAWLGELCRVTVAVPRKVICAPAGCDVEALPAVLAAIVELKIWTEGEFVYMPPTTPSAALDEIVLLTIFTLPPSTPSPATFDAALLDPIVLLKMNVSPVA